MSDDKKHETNEKIVYKTPPKMAFVIGILVGITLTSLTAFVMTYSLLKSDLSDTLATDNTNGQVAGEEVVVNTNTAAPSPTPSPTPAKVDITVKDTDHIKGDKNAPIAMVEYSDFECPYSARVQPTHDKILEEYKGKVKVVYRHFPLSFHPNAQKAAEASECAAEQGKFWEMHDKIFENQKSLDVDSLKGYAKELGLNTSNFNKCLDDGKYTQKIKDDMTEGSQYGVKGTPATFINGQLVSGAQPYENFTSVIDSFLD